jgi:hypothetical protein
VFLLPIEIDHADRILFLDEQIEGGIEWVLAAQLADLEQAPADQVCPCGSSRCRNRRHDCLDRA